MSIIYKHKMKSWVSFEEGWNVTANTCIGLNILVITEQTITNLFARVLKVWHLMVMRAFLLLQQAE